MGRGTELAAASGDIVVLGEPLRYLPLLLRLSRETMRLIRQNILIFAFGVNIVGIVFTGLLWPLFATSPELYDKAPLVGVIYHQLGSLLVLFNSMRLLAFERRAPETWIEWKLRYRLFELWAERNLDADRLLHAAVDYRKSILIGVVTLLFAGWIASGTTVVEADELAVVQQFGQIQDNLKPGLHWCWPWPIDVVRKIKPAEIKVVSIDFRDRYAVDGDLQTSVDYDDTTWTSSHGGTEGRNASLFTGDRNLVDVRASVQYTITEPRAYLFAARQPQNLIRTAGEAVLREFIGSHPFVELLTTQRLEMQRKIAEKLEEQLAGLNGDGIGIHVVGVVIHDLHPPLLVAKDYYRLAKALQEKEQRRHRAHAEAARD